MYKGPWCQMLYIHSVIATAVFFAEGSFGCACEGISIWAVGNLGSWSGVLPVDSPSDR